MKYGLLMPLTFQSIDKNIELVNQLENENIDSLWLRDIPLIQTSNTDFGSKLDIFTQLTYMAEKVNQRYILGSAVINTGFRTVIPTINAMMSLISLYPNRKFDFGIGEGTKQEACQATQLDWGNKTKEFIKWITKYNELSEKVFQNKIKVGDAYMTWPKKVSSLPKLTLSTKNEEVINKFSSIIESDILWFSTQDEIKNLQLKFSNTNFQLFLSVDLVENFDGIDYINKGQKFIRLSPETLVALAAEYKTLGISRIILSINNSENINTTLNKLLEKI